MGHLNDANISLPSELTYPWNVASKVGDFVAAGQSAEC